MTKLIEKLNLYATMGEFLKEKCLVWSIKTSILYFYLLFPPNYSPSRANLISFPHPFFPHRQLIENLNRFKVKPLSCPECDSIVWCTGIFEDDNSPKSVSPKVSEVTSAISAWERSHAIEIEKSRSDFDRCSAKDRKIAVQCRIDWLCVSFLVWRYVLMTLILWSCILLRRVVAF